MSGEKLPPYLRHVQPTPDDIGRRIRADAQQHWDEGFTHFYLTVDSPEHATRLIQWVENVGWHLEHVGWV